jgi:hypothetical protein
LIGLRIIVRLRVLWCRLTVVAGRMAEMRRKFAQRVEKQDVLICFRAGWKSLLLIELVRRRQSARIRLGCEETRVTAGNGALSTETSEFFMHLAEAAELGWLA